MDSTWHHGVFFTNKEMLHTTGEWGTHFVRPFPDGSQMVPRWFPDGSQMVPRWFPHPRCSTWDFFKWASCTRPPSPQWVWLISPVGSPQGAGRTKGLWGVLEVWELSNFPRTEPFILEAIGTNHRNQSTSLGSCDFACRFFCRFWRFVDLDLWIRRSVCPVPKFDPTKLQMGP